MELRVLRYFLAVAREENITKAAQFLHITQPTLSRQLRQLEEEFGVKLFRRSKHSIRLTEEGLLLRRRAQEVVELAEKTEREMMKRDEIISGEITMGCGETVNLQYIADCMAAFRSRYPEVHFSIYTGMADDVKERIERGLLDFGILIEPVDISRYDFIPLPAKDKWVALMNIDDPLAVKPFVTAADLQNRSLIVAGRESVNNMLRNWFGTMFAKKNVSVYMNLSAYNKTLLVRAGLGIALGLDLEYNHDTMYTCPLEPPIDNGSFLVWKKNQFSSAAIEAFIAYSRTYLAHIAESLEES